MNLRLPVTAWCAFCFSDPASIECEAKYCGNHGTCAIEQRYYQPECM